jgi:hypothetical protein
MSRNDDETPSGVRGSKIISRRYIHMLKSLASYDESLIPNVERALNARGYNVELSCDTMSSIIFNQAGSIDEEYLVSFKDGLFTIYKWTFVSEDWAEYLYDNTITLQEVLQA